MTMPTPALEDYIPFHRHIRLAIQDHYAHLLHLLDPLLTAYPNLSPQDVLLSSFFSLLALTFGLHTLAGGWEWIGLGVDIAICGVGVLQISTACGRDDTEDDDENEGRIPRWKEKVELIFHLVSLDMIFPPALNTFSTDLGVGSGGITMWSSSSFALRPHWVWIGRILKIVCLFILGGRIKTTPKPPVRKFPVETGQTSCSTDLGPRRSGTTQDLSVLAEPTPDPEPEIETETEYDTETWLKSLLGDLNPNRLPRELSTSQYRSIGVQTSQNSGRRVHARVQPPDRTSEGNNGGSVSSISSGANRGKGVGGLNLRVAGSEERSTKPLTVFKGIEEEDEYRDDEMNSKGTEIEDEMDSPRMSQQVIRQDPSLSADTSASEDDTEDETPDKRQSTDSSWEEVRHEEHVPTKGVVRGKSGPRSEADEEEDPGHGRTKVLTGMCRVEEIMSLDEDRDQRMEEVEADVTGLNLSQVHTTGVDLGWSPSASTPADLTSFDPLALPGQGTSHHGRSTLPSGETLAEEGNPLRRVGMGSRSPDTRTDETEPESSNQKRDADVVESGSEDEETGDDPVGALQSRQSDAGYEYADEDGSSRFRAKEVVMELGSSAGASTSSINVRDVEFAQDKITTTPGPIATPEHHPFQPTIIAPLAPLRLSGRRSHGHRQTASQSDPHDHPSPPEREPADVSTYKALQRFRSNLAELDPTFTFDPRHAREGGHRRARTIDVRSSTTVRLDDLLKREEEFEL